MTEIDNYEKVRQKLTCGPLTAVKHEKIYELMKVFWDEETIKVLTYFPNAGEPITANELAEKSGLQRKEIKNLLNKAVKKRTLAKIGPDYCLEPILPGIFEAYFIARQDSEENLKKAASIYRYMFENSPEFREKREGYEDFRLFRPILPIESEKLIKVDESIPIENKVMPYEVVEELIKNNEHFAVIPCQCRLISELSGKDLCQVASADMGCFLVGPSAQGVVAMGMGRGLTKEEAIEYLKKTEKAGLVHNASNDTSPNTFICNCCSCHCGALFPQKQFEQITNLNKSNFEPKFNSELCVSCKTCMKKCPMEAISFIEAEEKMLYNSESCIGCGVCAANCPKNAILMEKIRNDVPPDKNIIKDKTFSEMITTLLVGG